ncbi:NAD(P)(+) transhydrogenase (Re/Si-specific) subunit beta [Thermosynechococcus vestitus]|uniref:NAD(P) transhydrogenase subunit beta n=1 Tax=Thermosynechococcus vestitus (strain NIES-2133 / IAM M-273 / BP-1) TaxID=197221 RepID=Q8DL03_THEVB|nr:NAD(P)(+) transhydrogenase (Re/Si-specific) subunit beta [Thermosynechococcus vestitus]BAC08247.1 pyridine nucleotide transhydrogenase beta subunit [Thermosynechococcus vestitus BP-1]
MDWLTRIEELSYLGAAALFILGLKKLGSPATARQGNCLAALGMLIAIVVTLLDRQMMSYTGVLAAIGLGSVIGAIAAYKVEMTAMPQMVGLLNGLGGAASALVGIGEFCRSVTLGEPLTPSTLITIILGVLIGGVTLTGSLVAFGKLQGLMSGTPIIFPMQQAINLGLLVAFLVASGWVWLDPSQLLLFWGLVAIASVLGVLFVLPIGGADMPVVISLLNSLSGLAASAAGFIVGNSILIIAGALVGASGLILTQIMCKAMNRSLANVLFSGFGSTTTGNGAVTAHATAKSVRTIDPEESAMMLGYAKSVVIVPGYGMAVAQAQHSVKELADQLERLGVDVKYAIHPVAGRMPGHMNVLLAEANVPYPQLKDMEDINPEFENVDIALVIGANDVVNPAARTNPGSPVYGMPILDVDRARHTIVIKRSLNPGFAGIDNELFYKEKTLMLFGNAKEVLNQLIAEVKHL